MCVEDEGRIWKKGSCASSGGYGRMCRRYTPLKVQNIVSQQLAHFRRLYSPLMDNLPNLSIVKSDDNPKSTVLKQDMSAIRRSNMVARLPTSFKSILHRHYARKFEI